MKDHRRLEEIGNVDEAFIKEVFDYTEKSGRRHIMSNTFILKTAAIAACAAVVIGAGAAALSGKELPVKTEDAGPAITSAQTEAPAAAEPEPVSEAVTEPLQEVLPAPAVTEEEEPAPAPAEPEAPVESEPVKEPETVVEEKPEEKPEPSESSKTEEKPNESDVVVVERSYNERIADGEDVSIETYIGIPYRISSEKYSVVGDFTYTLKSVSISDSLPEGVEKDDLDVNVGPVMKYGEDGVKAYSTEDGKRALDIGEFLDENGVYTGPGNGYKWVFLTLDVTNNSDQEVIKFINTLRLAGGEYKTYSLSLPGINGGAVDADFREYEYFEELCYQSARYFDYAGCYEMTFANVSDERRAEIEKKAIERYGSFENYLREKFAGMTHFDAGETKTVTVGFPVNTYFVYGDLFLELNPSGVLNPEVIEYIPLK